MTKPIGGLSQEQWDKLKNSIDRKQFELKSTQALPWWMYAEDVYRSAEILAAKSIQENKKSLVTRIDRLKKEPIALERLSTIEEDVQAKDIVQIRIAYFLLARAIELLLKAVIIEVTPDAFFDKLRFKLKMSRSGHDIYKMMQNLNIVLNNEQDCYLQLLSHYPFIGTYPVPLDVQFVRTERELQEKFNKKLDHKNYDEVSQLYELVLEKYNEVRTKNGKSKRVNHLRISKD